MLNAKQDNTVSKEENDSKQNEYSRKSEIKLTDNTDTSPWTPVWYKLRMGQTVHVGITHYNYR